MEFYTVETEQQARELCRIMPEVVAIDTEYVSGDPRTTKLLSVVVADSERAWVVSPSLLPVLKDTIRARKLVFLQDYNHCDTIILLKHGVDLRETNCHNLIDMHHLQDENAGHDLDARIRAVSGDDYKAVFWDKYKAYEDAPPEEALEYAGKDGVYTYRLGARDYAAVSGMDLYWHTRELSKALLDTELDGLCVNESLMIETKTTMKEQINDYIPKLRSQFKDQCDLWEFNKWTKEIEKRSSIVGKQRVGRPSFSFNSNSQLRELLFEEIYLGLRTEAKTKKGNPSTSYESLKELEHSRPELQTLVEFKDLKGVYATFVEGMLERVKDGRIYPHFNVSGTATGRISHSDPNMGNLPKDGIIRNFFIPSPDMVIIGADYAQLEVVVELNLTEDPGLREIVCGGASKHDLFKADLDRAGFNIPRAEVKNINFALQYGAGAGKIAKMVGCSIEDADQIINTFYTRFSGVKTLKDQTNAIIAKDSKITNLAGRTRHFPKPGNKYELFRQQRQAYNFLIQGVAGEACNRAYYRFHTLLKEHGLGRALFPVHDEIVAEVQNDPQIIEHFMMQLTRKMEQSTQDFDFKYPLKAKAYGAAEILAENIVSSGQYSETLRYCV